MMPELEYVGWIHERLGETRHDLGRSNLQWGGNDPLRPAVLDDGPDPAASRSFREYVADAYDVAPERVLVTAGATHAMVLACITAFDGAGVRILVEWPGYEPLRSTPRLFGATVDRFDRPPAERYSLDPDRVAAAMETDTSLVVVTNRHNPSGRSVDRETLAAVADAVADRGARLLVDEVYAPFGSAPAADRAFGGPTAAGLPETVVASSLTKFQGLDGLRIGWLIADPSFVDRARTALHHLPAVSEPGLELGRRALAMGEELSAQARARIGTNATSLRSFVDGRDDLTGPVYEGANFAFLRHDRTDGDAVADAAWDEGVLVVPGRFFEEGTRFRVSLAGESSTMRDALDALGTALDRC